MKAGPTRTAPLDPDPRALAAALGLLGVLALAAGFGVAAALGLAGRALDVAIRPIENALSGAALTVIVPYLVWIVVEVVVLGYRQSSLWRILHPDGSTRTDIICFALWVSGVIPALVLLFTGGAALLGSRALQPHLELGLMGWPASPVLGFLCYLVFYDFLIYWSHRLAHRVPWWWELHKFHHSATRMNLITTYRMHPIDRFLRRMFVLVPLAVIGAPPEQLVAIVLLNHLQRASLHTDLPWTWGWLGRWLVLSPAAHRVHHSAQREHYDTNFGRLTPIWDRLFGTWYEADESLPDVSVDDNYGNRFGMVFDLVESTRRALLVASRQGRIGSPKAF